MIYTYTFMPTIFGNRSFGVFAEPSCASDYTQSKRAQIMKTPSQKTTKLSGGIHTSNRKSAPIHCDIYPFEKKDLIVNLYSKEDLQDVTTLCKGTNVCAQSSPNIDSTKVPFCQNYIIDPTGALFGSSQCGINNFTNYMVPDVE